MSIINASAVKEIKKLSDEKKIKEDKSKVEFFLKSLPQGWKITKGSLEKLMTEDSNEIVYLENPHKKRDVENKKNMINRILIYKDKLQESVFFEKNQNLDYKSIPNIKAELTIALCTLENDYKNTDGIGKFETGCPIPDSNYYKAITIGAMRSNIFFEYLLFLKKYFPDFCSEEEFKLIQAIFELYGHREPCENEMLLEKQFDTLIKESKFDELVGKAKQLREISVKSDLSNKSVLDYVKLHGLKVINKDDDRTPLYNQSDALVKLGDKLESVSPEHAIEIYNLVHERYFVEGLQVGCPLHYPRYCLDKISDIKFNLAMGGTQEEQAEALEALLSTLNDEYTPEKFTNFINLLDVYCGSNFDHKNRVFNDPKFRDPIMKEPDGYYRKVATELDAGKTFLRLMLRMGDVIRDLKSAPTATPIKKETPIKKVQLENKEVKETKEKQDFQKSAGVENTNKMNVVKEMNVAKPNIVSKPAPAVSAKKATPSKKPLAFSNGAAAVASAAKPTPTPSAQTATPTPVAAGAKPSSRIALLKEQLGNKGLKG